MTLSTAPPQVSHGAGVTFEASHDMAAHQALRALAELDSGATAPGGVAASVQPSAVGMPAQAKVKVEARGGGSAPPATVVATGAGGNVKVQQPQDGVDHRGDG